MPERFVEAHRGRSTIRLSRSRHGIAFRARRTRKLALLNHSLPLYLTECVEGRALDAFVTAHDVVFVDVDGNIAEDVRSATRNDCVDMGASLGLGFYRLSLVEAADDEWFCLGLDRMPQLYNCAPDAQFQIARHLADSLSARLGA
jgi:hypothetical protein